MSGLTVTKTRIYAGVWEGVVQTGRDHQEAPDISVSHLGQELENFELTNDPEVTGQWFLCVPIPPELLLDGVQVFLICEKESGEKLSSFTIVTGEPLEDDIRAEVELLRAELDMLKRAFRRHCLETQ